MPNYKTTRKVTYNEATEGFTISLPRELVGNTTAFDVAPIPGGILLTRVESEEDLIAQAALKNPFSPTWVQAQEAAYEKRMAEHSRGGGCATESRGAECHEDLTGGTRVNAPPKSDLPEPYSLRNKTDVELAKETIEREMAESNEKALPTPYSIRNKTEDELAREALDRQLKRRSPP